jgi:Zn-dependent protease
MINQTAWIIFSLPSILLASSIHEYSHALAATKLGDNTPKYFGRLTLNPLAHLDPIGVIAMVLFKIGWSKPVPITPTNFKNPDIGEAIVSLAGPLSNFLLALILGLILRFTYPLLNFESPVTLTILTFLVTFLTVNVVLGVFNLIPIPPLDGHKVVSVILPSKLRYFWKQLDRYGLIIVLIAFMPYSPIAIFFERSVNYLIELILQFSIA